MLRECGLTVGFAALVAAYGFCAVGLGASPLWQHGAKCRAVSLAVLALGVLPLGGSALLSQVNTPYPTPPPPALTPSPSASAAERLGVIEARLESQREGIADVRALLYGVIGILFLVIVGFVSLAVWIEQKGKAAAAAIRDQAGESRDLLARHSAEQLDQFRRAIASKSSDDLIQSGKVLYWTGKPAKAVEILTRALEYAAGDLEARKFRGLAYRDLATEAWPSSGRDSHKYLQLAINDLSEAAADAGAERDAELQFTLGAACLVVGDWREAIDRANGAERAGYPNPEEIDLIRGEALDKGGDLAGAKGVYSKAIARNNRCTTAIRRLSELLMREKDFSGAIDALTAGIDNRQGVSTYHVYRARAYASRNQPGDGEKAELDFQEAENLNKKDWDLWFYRGRSHLEAAIVEPDGTGRRERLDSAIDYLEHGTRIARRGKAARFYNQLCRAYLCKGMTDDAVSAATKSVQDNSWYVENHLTLATALLADARWPDAVAASERGLTDARESPRKIWCLLFKIVGKALQRYGISSLRSEAFELVARIEGHAGAGVPAWEWSGAEKKIDEDLSHASVELRSLVADLKRLMSDPGSTAAFRAQWLT